MNILIIYATNSGSTFLTARLIGKMLAKKHHVTIKKTVEVHPHELSLYPVILLGSPSWNYEDKEGQPHETMSELLEKMKDVDVSHTRFAVFGCGDSSYTYFCGAVDEMSRWLKDHHGEEIVEPLKIDGYYFDLEGNNKKVDRWTKELMKTL